MSTSIARKAMPEVSVIVPAYNQAAFLAEAIQSVCDQTFTDWQLVVVDDGSTDETDRVLASFQDPRISIVRQPQRGVSAARNLGVSQSSAPLVAFLDADDLLLPNTLAALHGYLGEHPAICLAGGSKQCFDSSTRASLTEKAITPIQFDVPELLLANDISTSGVMLRRQAFELVGGFDESMRTCEDWDLWLRLAVAGCQLSRAKDAVAHYRIHSAQVTGDTAAMRGGTLGLWRKFFSLPNLPSWLHAYRDPAVAAALVRTAARAFGAAEFEIGNTDLAEAIKLDPSLCGTGYKKLADLLRGWAIDPRTRNPQGYLISISQHLPSSLLGLRRHLRRAAAEVILESFFGASRDNWRSRRRELLKALYYDPSWLANRGVLRMLADTWLPLSENTAA